MSVSISLTNKETLSRQKTGRRCRYLLIGLIIFLSIIAEDYSLNSGLLILFFFASLWFIRLLYGIRFPAKESVHILHQDSFASGATSRRYLIFQAGGAYCLKITISTEEIWVSTWFPFTSIIELCGLEHRILLRDIVNVNVVRKWFQKQIKLTYQIQKGELTIYLMPRDLQVFYRALDHDGALRAAGKLHLN